MDALMHYLQTDILNTTFGSTAFSDYMSDDRDFDIRAVVYRPGNGTPFITLTASEIVSYNINEQSGSSGYQIGSVISAAYAMVVDNTTAHYTASDFSNAYVAAAIGLHNGSVYEYEAFGVWKITNVDAAEQSTTITLNGMDSLGVHYNTLYVDNYNGLEIDYGFTTIEGLLQFIMPREADTYDDYLTFASYLYETTALDTPTELIYWYDYPAGYVGSWQNSISSSAFHTSVGENNVTYRSILSWIAIMAGCAVRMSRDGTLTFIAYDKAGTVQTITPDEYYTLTPQCVDPFVYNELDMKYYLGYNTEDEQTVTRQVNSSLASLPSNTIQVSATPFTTQTTANTIHSHLSGDLSSEGLTLEYIGCPLMMIGDHVTITDMQSVSHSIVINSMTTKFSGGLSMTIAASLPSNDEPLSASYGYDSSIVGGLVTNYGKAAYVLGESPTKTYWIDGSAIYRQIFQATLSSTSETQIGTITDFSFAVRIYGTSVRRSDSINFPLNTTWGSSMSSGAYTYAYVKADGKVYARTTSANFDVTVIVEYTKTS